jgi:hypothetical protein
LEDKKEEWFCSCGTANPQNFCANCGKKREDALSQKTMEASLLQNTQVFPSAQDLEVAPGCGVHEAKKQNNTIKYLAAVAVVLFLSVVGLYAYISGSEERYIAKCEDAQKIILDVQSAVKDIKGLNGDTESEDTKKYLDRLKTGQGNLENIQKELKGMHGSSKYKEENSVLLEMLLLERNILQDVDSVLRDPLAQESPAAIKRVHDNAIELMQNAGGISIEHTDFSAAFQLGAIAEDLNKYVDRKKALDSARKVEQERQARAAAIAKAVAFRKQLSEKNQQIMNTNELVWITTNASVQGNDLVVSGYFYNGSPNPIVKVDSMVVHVNLSLDGESVVRDAQVNFSNMYMPGLLVPGGKNPRQLIIQNSAPNKNFNEFDVTADNIHWLYQ